MIFYMVMYRLCLPTKTLTLWEQWPCLSYSLLMPTQCFASVGRVTSWSLFARNVQDTPSVPGKLGCLIALLEDTINPIIYKHWKLNKWMNLLRKLSSYSLKSNMKAKKVSPQESLSVVEIYCSDYDRNKICFRKQFQKQRSWFLKNVVLSFPQRSR